jgi:hypothetical protein
LAQEAQAVVRERRQVQQAIVGVELARGQSLQIEIGLDLRVELLMRAVVLVQFNDRFRLEVEAGPPQTVLGTKLGTQETKNPQGLVPCGFLLCSWRRGWDSNPCARLL